MELDFEEYYKSDENWKFYSDFSEIEDKKVEKEIKNELIICSVCNCDIDSNFFFFCRECNFFLCKLCNINFYPKSNTFCICNEKNKKIYSSLRILEFPIVSNHFDIWITNAFLDYLKLMSIFYSYVQDRSLTNTFYANRYFNSTLFKIYTTFSKVGIFKKDESEDGYQILLQVFSGSFYCSSYEVFVKKCSSLQDSLYEFRVRYKDENEISLFLNYIMNEMEQDMNSSIRTLKKKLKFIVNF